MCKSDPEECGCGCEYLSVKVGDVLENLTTHCQATIIARTSDGMWIYEIPSVWQEKIVVGYTMNFTTKNWKKEKKSLGWINVWKTSQGFMCSSKPHATKANAEESWAKAFWINLEGVSRISCVEIFEE